MIANIALKARGYFKIESFNPATGQRRVLADWFPNLITNNGFDQYFNSTNVSGTSGPFAYCRVGSGTATPAITDSALQSQIASSNTIQSTTAGRASSSPYYAFLTRVFRFNPGVATGNLSEIGVAPAATGNLFSRALILDGFGSPTTITVLAGEILDVTYEFRLYSPTSDVTGTITLDGVSTNYTIRPIGVLVLPAGSSNLRVALDDDRISQLSTADVVLAYVRNGNLYWREQRDRYTVEYLFDAVPAGYRLYQIGMNVVGRMQFSFSKS